MFARRVDEEPCRPSDFCTLAGSGFPNYVIIRYVELRNSFSGQHARGSIGAGENFGSGSPGMAPLSKSDYGIAEMNMPMKSPGQANQSNRLAYYRNLLSTQPHRLKNLDALAVVVPFRHGQEICSQSQPIEYWYYLILGAARRSTIRPDGRRQIVDLLLPGDFFGLMLGDQSDTTVEAVAKATVVACYPRRRIDKLAESDPSIARDLHQIPCAVLSRMQAQLLILGRITAMEKVGSFILEMAARLSGGDSEQVALPVSRYDIADYLGVSVETVSRALSELKHRGAIKLLDTRTVSIVHRNVLEEGSAADCK
jgi:CRP/FNR family nitrogen fixation transcriptional regulator